jgi:hypothetical protein
MLDSDQAKLGPFFPGAAVPWNGTIDAHTMKVLESQVGGEGYETAANIRATMKKWLTKVGP